jgi:hypothetical protein
MDSNFDISEEESNSLTSNTFKKSMMKENNTTESGCKNGRWLPCEHLRFLKGCLIYGNNWKKVNIYSVNLFVVGIFEIPIHFFIFY